MRKNEVFFKITAVKLEQRKLICKNVQYILKNDEIKNVKNSVGICFSSNNSFTLENVTNVDNLRCSFIEIDCKVFTFFPQIFNFFLS